MRKFIRIIEVGDECSIINVKYGKLERRAVVCTSFIILKEKNRAQKVFARALVRIFL